MSDENKKSAADTKSGAEEKSEAVKKPTTASKKVKAKSSYQINLNENYTEPVWQKGFHDHAIRKEEEIKDIAR